MPYEAMVREVKTLSYDEQLNLMAVLVEAMKAAMHNTVSVSSVPKQDYSDTYPPGYFKLFGSDPTFFDEPEDIPLADDPSEMF